MKLINSFLALALSATAAAMVTLLHGTEALIAPQVLPCAAAAALRASFASPLPLSSSSSCSGARCELSLVSFAGGAAAASSSSCSSSSSSSYFSAPLRNGINAVSIKGMDPGVWEASATCGRGCTVVAVAAVGGGRGGEEENVSTSLSSSSSPSTARIPFLVQQCNDTLSQSMVEMEARFVVAEARSEAGKGKSGVSSSSSSLAAAKGVRVAAATAALAASQVGLVALAVA